VVVNSCNEYSKCSSITTFLNKLLLVVILEVYFTINGIEYVMDYMFGKYCPKHDKNMRIEVKTNPRNLQNMIET